MTLASKPQPAPTRDERSSAAVLPDVLAALHPESKVRDDLKARAAEGENKYGTPLFTHNGRDALVDAYQEILDAMQYLKQAHLEMGGDGPITRTVLASRIECQFEAAATLARQLRTIIDDRS